MKGRQGFTLMELLVVLLIIGILSTVALRTIDATRDRSLFDQTTKEMNQLVQAITGNPDMTYDGRRIDFGFFGDEGKLPDELRDLVHNPNPSDTNWHGPYVRQTVGGDTAGYLLDGWGHPYFYKSADGTITSLGNGKYPMTVRVADSLALLYINTISGTITDGDNNPPGQKDSSIMVTLYPSSGHQARFKFPDPGGYYQFSVATFDTVPIGTHRLVAKMAGGDSLTRWVTVSPRSHPIVDFRFSKSFRNQLRMVGEPLRMQDSSGFIIHVVNDGTTEDTVTGIVFVQSPDSAHMRELWVGGSLWWTALAGESGKSQGDTVYVAPPFPVPPNMSAQVDFAFQKFYKEDPPGDSVLSHIAGKTFRFRFNDGSEIEVRP
jgi:prepilin-type N-terminal cleavage/methylation domain-containing protein